jgi:arylsulfatase
VRNETWKLVSTSKDTTWHLYRIHSDESEMNDVSAQYPDVVKQLASDWQQWAIKEKVFPKK